MQPGRTLYYIARRIETHHVSSNLPLTRLLVRRIATTANLLDFSRWGTKKANKKLKISVGLDMDPESEKILSPLRDKVNHLNLHLQELRSNGAPELDIKKVTADLRLHKKILEEKEVELTPHKITFNKARMEDLLKRRFYVDQSFSIYGGLAGLFDFGPVGCSLKTNLIQAWRNFFILGEQMLEVDCASLTPEVVLKASGHVERFADSMVKDVKTGECFRLDHLIKMYMEKKICDKKTDHLTQQEFKNIIRELDGMTVVEMADILCKYNIKSPFTGNDLSPPMDFNLMFGTQIGASGFAKAFLRPETAQGIFVNFKRLLAFNQERLPFAVAQIGNAFRNEISPRSGLLRVREFTMAEIEHFCDPDDKNHPKFKTVEDTIMQLYSADHQMSGMSACFITIGEAVSTGLVANETLGYYMTRIHQFLLKVGIKETRLRFRQHMSTEMAHYACDCWDAECLTSYGWIECVGCADRSAYDLKQHSKASGVKLVAEKKLSAPKMVDICELVLDKVLIGKTFKKHSRAVIDKLDKLSEAEILDLEECVNGKPGVTSGKELKLSDNVDTVWITKDMIKVKRYQKTVHVEEIIPSVIEPSFGIGRIMYALFEHNFVIRENDEKRTYFALPPVIAPLKCSVLPLSNNDEFMPFVKKLSQDLTEVNVSHKVDDSSGSIGRRYARTDELAIPFGITIDFDTLKAPHSATLRDRDSMEQVRINLDELPGIVRDLSYGRTTWAEVEEKYPKFEQQESTES